MPAQLQRIFEHEAFVLLQRIRTEARYPAPYFGRMLHERGALAAARHLIHASKPSLGFDRLYEIGRLDLSVEAFVLEPRWQELFTPEDLAAARWRLADYGYKPKTGEAA